MGRSHRLRVCRLQLVAHFGLAFATAPRLRRLTLLQTSNSPDHYAKGTPSAACGASSALGLRPLVGTRFQVLFHSPPGVLFTFPSRYWFTIGHERVFSLARWSSRIPTGFHVSCGTWETRQGANALSPRTFTFCGSPFQAIRLACWFVTPRPYGPLDPATPPHASVLGFRLFPFRSPLLRESSFLSLPRGTEMFQFPRFASRHLWIQ